MTDEEFKQLSKNLELREPTSLSAVEKVQSECGLQFPQDYVSFLLRSNGADGAIGDSGYLSLWLIEEIAELNRGYRVEEFAPGVLLFGSDEGGEAFGFDLREISKPILEIPFVGMSLDDARFIAPTFTEFLKGV